MIKITAFIISATFLLLVAMFQMDMIGHITYYPIEVKK